MAEVVVGGVLGVLGAIGGVVVAHRLQVRREARAAIGSRLDRITERQERLIEDVAGLKGVVTTWLGMHGSDGPRRRR